MVRVSRSRNSSESAPANATVSADAGVTQRGPVSFDISSVEQREAIRKQVANKALSRLMCDLLC